MSLQMDLVTAVYNALMVRKGMTIDASVALERARNIVQGLVGNYDVREFDPDPRRNPGDIIDEPHT